MLLRNASVGTFFLYFFYLIGFSTLFFILLFFSLQQLQKQREVSNKKKIVKEIAARPAFSEIDDPLAFVQEDHYVNEKTEFKAWYMFRTKPHQSKYINVSSQGIRHTKPPATTIASDAKTVFVFGGSAAWGFGTPDDLTIPSLLWKNLGPKFRVVNYAERMFTTTQNMNLLLELLSANKKPDIVIFYDGWNDTLAGTLSPGIPRQPMFFTSESSRNMQTLLGPLNSEWFELAWQKGPFNYFFNLLALHGGPSSTSHPFFPRDAITDSRLNKNIQRTLDSYLEFTRQVKSLALVYKFEPYFFWQPNLISGKNMVFPYEQEIIAKRSPALRKAFQEMYLASKSRLQDKEEQKIYFLGDIFKNSDQPVYVDSHHTSSFGNRIIAKKIAKQISP